MPTPAFSFFTVWYCMEVTFALVWESIPLIKEWRTNPIRYGIESITLSNVWNTNPIYFSIREYPIK